MDIGLAVYLVVALVTIELTLIYARIEFEQPCRSREDLIGTGCFIALSWPVTFFLVMVFGFFVLTCSILDYLWRIEL